MTREELSKKIQSNQIVSDSSRDWMENLVSSIFNDFETANCKNCKWLKDEVCVNADSLKCADYPDVEMMCNEWEKKDV